jgi:hypothetical protein
MVGFTETGRTPSGCQECHRKFLRFNGNQPRNIWRAGFIKFNSICMCARHSYNRNAAKFRLREKIQV